MLAPQPGINPHHHPHPTLNVTTTGPPGKSPECWDWLFHQSGSDPRKALFSVYVYTTSECITGSKSNNQEGGHWRRGGSTQRNTMTQEKILPMCPGNLTQNIYHTTAFNNVMENNPMHRGRGVAKKHGIVIYASQDELTMATCIHSDESVKQKAPKTTACDSIHTKVKHT